MAHPLNHEAIERFTAVRERAAQLSLAEPDAMALATADAAGRPTVRIILLRGFDERGFVFFTNAHSLKGEQLTENPQASLCFYWDQLAEQVRVTGRVELVSDAESDAYWSRRRRLSQIAAVASEQSAVLPDYAGYERRVRELEQQFAGQPIPRPPHWHGYRVVPQHMEFWEGRDGRMHMRTVYEQRGDAWVKFMLYP